MAGETLGSKKLVYLTATGDWKLADANTAATMPVLGITKEYINVGQGGSIHRYGYIGRSDWTWTIGGAIYASETAGELTQTAPELVNNVVQPVAYAESKRIIFFNPHSGRGLTGPTYTKTVDISAEMLGKGAANNPTVVDINNVTLYSFTVNTDFMTYKLTIPTDYATGGLKLNAVWTNDGNTNDNGKNVRLQIDYQVATEGDAVNGSHANSPKNVNDAYTSATGWIENDSDYVTIAEADFTGKLCVFVKVSFVTAPDTVLTCEPHLIGICLQYIAYTFA